MKSSILYSYIVLYMCQYISHSFCTLHHAIKTSPLTRFACSFTTQDSELHVIHFAFLLPLGQSCLFSGVRLTWAKHVLFFFKSFLDSNTAVIALRSTPPHTPYYKKKKEEGKKKHWSYI